MTTAQNALVSRAHATGTAAEAARVAVKSRSDHHRDRLLLPGVAALVGLAWIVGRAGTYDPGSSVGYALGLVGGIAMLFVLLYPLRKRVRFLRAWGATKHWFVVHMVCGIGGPLLVLAHSKFQVGSVNAAVALTCMLLVAASGIIGRFIYVRIHHGLYGTRATLHELQAQLGMSSQEVQSRLGFAPRIEQGLKEFERAALARRRGVAGVWAFLTLGLRARLLRHRCRREVTTLFLQQATVGGTSDGCRELFRVRCHGTQCQEHSCALINATMHVVGAYLHRVQRVAQFSAYEKMFSLWHVLHAPLVWLLVLSALAHVAAVHAY